MGIAGGMCVVGGLGRDGCAGGVLGNREGWVVGGDWGRMLEVIVGQDGRGIRSSDKPDPESVLECLEAIKSHSAQVQ